MRMQKIRQMIRNAVTDEAQTHRLANLIVQVARQQGRRPSAQDTAGAVSFVQEYVEHVPLVLEQAVSVGRQLQLGREIDQLVSELENYWFEADDLIPDHQGLVGIVDDAYATLALFQAMSDYCSATFGRPLLHQNLTQANLAMRGLIGEPLVSILESRIGVTLGNAMLGRILNQVANAGFAMPAAPDPIWGNASIDDIVTARLGAMGVV